MKRLLLFSITLFTAVTFVGCRSSEVSDNKGFLPPEQCNLKLTAPVEDWWEAIPLGNGQLGALIWGKANELTIKLDRCDVWDERINPLWKTSEFTWETIQKYRDEGKFERISEIFDNHYHNEPPTHVAIGKILLTLPDSMEATVFNLDLSKAEAVIDYKNQSPIKAFASATEPVIMMRVPGKLKDFDVWAPGMNGSWNEVLKYPSPVMSKDKNSCWYTQSVPEGPTFVVYAKRQEVAGNTLIAMTVTTNEKDGNPLDAAIKRTDKALNMGYEKLMVSHADFWNDFWSTSSVSVPDEKVMQHYYLTKYYFGSNSRPGFPAMGTTEGVWTDDLQFPAFKNNLHNDLESQVQYQSYQTAGNFEEGRVIFDFWWDMLPKLRKYAKDFFNTDGAAVPGVMTWGGQSTTGWPQYSNSPTMAGWIGWLFYQHWRYTQDVDFLKNRAYPWCVEIAQCWEDLLKPDENGILKLPLSSTSEVYDNTPRSWMVPNTNFDIDLMKVHLLGLAEMAQVLGKGDESKHWTNMADSLGEHYVDNQNALMWSANEPVTFLHRHFSHAMSIHPFNLITIAGTDREREVIEGTMHRFDSLSVNNDFKGDWAGWSFPWMSSMRARVGQGEEAYNHLKLFLDGWITRNGFHMNVNNGKTKASGHGFFFTIEGNILATQAVQDMLIQSWAPSIGKNEPGIVRIFSSTPDAWQDASFRDLRTEGGFKVSAVRKQGKTVSVRIEATTNGKLRLLDPFGSENIKWSISPAKKEGNIYEFDMKAGDILENV